MRNKKILYGHNTRYDTYLQYHAQVQNADCPALHTNYINYLTPSPNNLKGKKPIGLVTTPFAYEKIFRTLYTFVKKHTGRGGYRVPTVYAVAIALKARVRSGQRSALVAALRNPGNPLKGA